LIYSFFLIIFILIFIRSCFQSLVWSFRSPRHRLGRAVMFYSVKSENYYFFILNFSMKSVLQAYWLLTVSIGNIVVVAVAEAKIFDSQVSLQIIVQK
jgi:hypothetical protein